MDCHRRIAPSSIEFFSCDAPFSNFDFIEDNFTATDPIRRCFSLARSLGVRSLIVEDIPADGLIVDENTELLSLFPDYSMSGLKRLSFWSKLITDVEMLDDSSPNDLCGYAILKNDRVPSLQKNFWHIFEAVFRKYPHPHNCIPFHKEYAVLVGSREFGVPGVLYAQQNGLNKSCAHVALRTLLTCRLSIGDIPYSVINNIVKKLLSGYRPSDGLGPRQIRAVLDHFNIPYRDIDYKEEENNIRKILPFQKFLYSGIESGCGALLGFHMSGPKASRGRHLKRHIIPFFGHTFNKDTWVPEADIAYFKVGGGLGYIPSESWTSSFLGHDDNFGPNLCIPRLYVTPQQADYVIELLHDGVAYNSVQAEVVSLPFLYSLQPHLKQSNNRWIQRLVIVMSEQRLVLRSVCVPRDVYLNHLREQKDWSGKNENSTLINILSDLLPKVIWVVELSLPHLFPANERKIGEIIMNPFVKPGDSSVKNKMFLLARLPGKLFVILSYQSGSPNFINVDSNIVSHMPLINV